MLSRSLSKQSIFAGLLLLLFVVFLVKGRSLHLHPQSKGENSCCRGGLSQQSNFVSFCFFVCCGFS